MISKINAWFTKWRMLNVQEFAHANKKLLVIVCDPQDDTIFVSYNDKIVSGRIRSADGKEYNVVRNLLKHSKSMEYVEQFAAGLVQTMDTTLQVPQVSDFMKFVGDACIVIAKTLRFSKK